MLLSSGDSFPHLIKKRRSQLGFVTYLLNYPCNIHGGAGTFIAFYGVMGFHSKELIFHLSHQEIELNSLAAADCSLYLQLSSVFQNPFPSLVVRDTPRCFRSEDIKSCQVSV